MIWTTNFKIRKDSDNYYMVEVWCFIFIPIFIRID